MINFKEYGDQLLKIWLKDSESTEPIIGTVSGIGGLQPASPGFTPNPHSCLFLKFADEEHARQEDYINSEIISLYADDIESVEIL